jgi:hypothetical protein
MAFIVGTPTHRAVVKLYADGQHVEADQLVRYEGPDNWKYEPLDPVAAVKWRQSVAQPQRVITENLRTKAVLRPPMSKAEVAREQEIRSSRGAPIRIA